MAVLQISKIQVRRGQKTQSGIPNLSAGEFAWAVDAQELYIGNGSVSEGAPYVGNTRLLTELDASNIFQLANTYTYQGNGTSNIITGPNANSPIQRTLQDKLDDYVSLADFGAAGDGITDDTKALQRAIDQLYLNSDKTNPLARKKLRLPAGTYLVTATVFIPAYATLEGDGIDRTVIKQSTTSTAIFATADWTSSLNNKISFPNIQNTTKPRNISVSGMTLQCTTATVHGLEGSGAWALMYLDCVEDAVVENVKFLGVKDQISSISPLEGIEIRGEGSTTSKRIRIANCQFENIPSGIVSDYDITDTYILRSKFTKLWQGVIFGLGISGQTPQAYGPIRTTVEDCLFDTVSTTAIGTASNPSNTPTELLSINNRFINVGNEGSPNKDDDQAFNILVLQGGGGKSVNDYFSRTVWNQTQGIANRAVPEILGHVNYVPQATQYTILPVQTAPTKLAVIPKSWDSPFATEIKVTLDYVARQANLNVTRVGKVEVMTNLTTATIMDSFQYIGANTLVGDLQFQASLNTSTQALTVSVVNPQGSVSTKLAYQYSVMY